VILPRQPRAGGVKCDMQNPTAMPFPWVSMFQKKLSLIKIYSSQFLSCPQTIDQFTPSTGTPEVPHEAIWSREKMAVD
jgi:hypothetical protein